MKEQCSEIVVVYDGLARFQHRCNRRGVLNEDDKWWCKQHAPSSVKARQKASSDKYRAASEARDAVWKREKAVRDACEGVPTEQLRPGLLKELLAHSTASPPANAAEFADKSGHGNDALAPRVDSAEIPLNKEEPNGESLRVNHAANPLNEKEKL